MPVTMGGMASGMNTDDIIKKLLEVERKPIAKLERSKERSRLRKDTLKLLTNHLKEVNKSAKILYGFRASYDNKKALSSDKTVIDATATRKADKGVNRVKVLKIASIHKIASDPVDRTEKLSSGKFKIEVNEESHVIRFKGGTLKSLRDRLDEEASDIIGTSYIKTSGNNYVLTVQSKISGKKGEIKLTGGKDFLKKIGLVKGFKGEKKSRVNITFDKKFFTSYVGDKKIPQQKGSLSVAKDGDKITIKGLLWQEYIMPIAYDVKKDTVLEFDFLYKQIKDEEEKLPFRVELGPDEKIVVKGIELRGYNVSRIRPVEKKKEKTEFDSMLGVGVVSEEDGKRKEKVYLIDKDSKVKQEIPVGSDFAGKKISKVIFYCNDGTTVFSKTSIVTPVKEKGLLDPKNVIAESEDAKLNIDGVDVIRDKNNDLDDIIKGVTLNLKKASDQSVDITIDSDVDKAIDDIKKFVDAYNKYLEFHGELIKVEKVDKPTSDKKNLPKRGIFAGDMTVIRLENSIRRTVGSAYPSRADKPIKLFSQMGVSTGEINSDWESIKEGKLKINESLLRKTIIENPDGVKMFFGSDTDGDNRSDNGMAYTMNNRLKPYISFGKNIVSSKIDLENESIKLANERIEKREDHLKRYEAKLRLKFGRMEQSISKSKKQKSWLNQQMGGSNDK